MDGGHRGSGGYPPAPAVSIGRTRSKEGATSDTPFDPLYLLIPGDSSRSSGRGAAAALLAARRFSAGRPVALLDLDPAGRHLQAMVGPRDCDGLVEALEFGLSLQVAGFSLEDGIRFIPTGRLPEGGLRTLFEHPGWQRLLDSARRRGIRLLAYVAPDDNLSPLTSRASAALLLATPDEELKLHARLPDSLKIVGTIEPPPGPPSQPVSASAGDSGPARPVPTDPRPDELEIARGHDDTPSPGREPDPGVGPAPARDGSFASVFRALTADLDLSERAPDGPPFAPPAREQGASALSRTGAPPSTNETRPASAATAEGLDRTRARRTSPRESADHREAPDGGAGRPDPATRAGTHHEPLSDPTGLQRGLEAGPVGAASEARMHGASATDQDIPTAPTARGLSLPEWLQAAHARIDRVWERSRALQRKPTRLHAPSESPVDDAQPQSFHAAMEAVEARLETVEGGAAHPSSSPTDATARPEAPGSLLAVPPGATSASAGIPGTSPGRERFVRISVIAILGYWTFYIVWRWTFNLNAEALWFSIPVALAETWGWISAVLVGVIAWRLNHRPALMGAPPDQSVDAFIITRAEPIEVVRRTATSARDLRYPHHTWVVDTVGRAEIRDLAGELGVGYIAHAEAAGNVARTLNHALEVTSADFILTLEADHAVLPDALDALLGYLQDDRVAYVQTPPDLSEVDPLGFGMDDDTHRLREERRLHASLLQPGRDALSCAILSPGSAVMRRAALIAVGGFAPDRGAETIGTALLLHAEGWKSLYIAESFTYGLGGRSAASLNREREARAAGAMGTFRRNNPVTTPGLSLPQRISYFHVLTEPVAGLQKLILYFTPAAFFLTGFLPVRSLDEGFLAIFVPYLLLSVTYYEILSRGLVHTWLAQRSQMATFWAYTKSLATFLRGPAVPSAAERLQGREESPKVLVPQVTLVLVTALSIAWAAWATSSGWVDYGGWDSLALRVILGWAAATIILALWVIRRGIGLRKRRQELRYSTRFPIEVVPHFNGGVGEAHLALMETLTARGLSFRSVSRFPEGAELDIAFPLDGDHLRVRGVVANVGREPGDPAFVHGIAFEDLPPDVSDAIERVGQRTGGGPGGSGSGIGAFSTGSQWRSGSSGRMKVRLPVWVLSGMSAEEDEGGEAAEPVDRHVGVLEEVAPGGASLILREAVQPGTPVIYEVPGSDLSGEGAALYSRMLETPAGVRFLVGLQTLLPEPSDTPVEAGTAGDDQPRAAEEGDS